MWVTKVDCGIRGNKKKEKFRHTVGWMWQGNACLVTCGLGTGKYLKLEHLNSDAGQAVPMSFFK